MDLWAGIGKFLFLPSQQKLHFPKVFGFLLLALRLAHLKKMEKRLFLSSPFKNVKFKYGTQRSSYQEPLTPAPEQKRKGGPGNPNADDRPSLARPPFIYSLKISGKIRIKGRLIRTENSRTTSRGWIL